jgi:AAA15 family ATPase/GTPase
MLIQFSIKNFRTFKDKATLSMVANFDKDTREEDNVFQDSKFNLRILKSAIVYGANASGKSKLFEALLFMKHFIVNVSKDSQKGDKINVEPYRLNNESEILPSEFEVIFIHNKVMYRYGFQINSEEIISEWLYYKPKTKEIELFYRERQNFEIHEKNFNKGNIVIKLGIVRDNALLLPYVSQYNDENSFNVINWFKELNIISETQENKFNVYSKVVETGFKNNTISKIKNNFNKNKILEFLNAADLGIKEIFYEEVLAGISNDLNTELLEFKKELIDFDPEILSDITTIHYKYNNNKEKIGNAKFSVMKDESNGTKKFLFLSGLIIDLLEKGGVLIADELDANLHTNLVKKIILLFNSKVFNPNNAQLIFNTHDTNLLNSNLFRRDQIWFTEKNKYGEAKLYSLADFKTNEVRKNEPFEDNYIKGKYGAVPYLEFFDNLSNIALKYENEK